MKEEEEKRIREIVREERDKEREICIRIGRLDKDDYWRLRKLLNKKVFELTGDTPCIIRITDDEDVNIRAKDDW